PIAVPISVPISVPVPISIPIAIPIAVAVPSSIPISVAVPRSAETRPRVAIAVTRREERSGVPAVLTIAMTVVHAARVLGRRALARDSSGRAPGRHKRERDEPLSAREDDRAIGILAVLLFSHRSTLASGPGGVQANLQRRPGR